MKHFVVIPFFLLLALCSLPGTLPGGEATVVPGIEILVNGRRDLIAGKRVGVITNPTGLDRALRPTPALIAAVPGVRVVALFSPEHGINGGLQNFIPHGADGKTGVPVFSLHGETRRPTPEMLKDIDVLVFDIQDIGARSYTYVTTMRYCMEAAAKHNIPFIVCDRPNPVNGVTVDGPVLDPKFSSFIGAGPTAYLHGMTIGELARFFNAELGINSALTVVPMKGWHRSMTWRDTGLVWTPPSPHIPEPDTPWFYPATGIMGELSGFSVGVGYTLPFKIVGAPWIDADGFCRILNGKNLPGVFFQPFHYAPYYREFQDVYCAGCRIIITDEKTFKPVATGYHIFETLLKQYPSRVAFSLPENAKRISMFDNANGTDRVRRLFADGASADSVIAWYAPALEAFKKKREQYLLYH